MTTVEVMLSVNGRHVQVQLEPRESLLDVLREKVGLTGAHSACEQGACGACTVLLNGRAVQSCLIFGIQAAGNEVTTIEAVGRPNSLHPLQEAMRRHHALQCGYCTPGVIMAALELLESGIPPDRKLIEKSMSGNLCRCTGYQAIVDAIEEIAASGAAVGSAHSPRPDDSDASRSES